MRLRYHQLDINDSGNCCTLLELEPQFRTCFTYSHGISNLPWPYVLFLFQYTDVDGKYVYPGLYGQGLRVLMRTSPLNSFDDKIIYCPTEHHAQGLSCTDHGWDNSVFDSHQELIGTILEIWWGSPHYLNYPGYKNCPIPVETWKQMTLEEVVTSDKWHYDTTLKTLMRDKPNSYDLIDKPAGLFPSVLKRGPKLHGRR